MVVGWRDSVQLAVIADALGLHADDFLDRLNGFIAGYCRWCAEQDRRPGLRECTALAIHNGILTSIDEIYDLLQPPVLPGDTLGDLVRATQLVADEFAEELARELARDAFRALKHTFDCPRCTACANGHRPRRQKIKPIARRVVYA